MLWGGWGERKRERSGHDGKGKERREAPAFSLFPSSPAPLSIFSIIAIGIISWSLCGGESPEGGDQGQIVCAENIYAPTKDNDIINFLNNLRTILQKENLDDEENIIIRGDFNCPLNPALDKKRWYNVIEEISY